MKKKRVGKGLLEKHIENQILGWLKMRGILSFKIKSMGTFDPTKRVFRKPSPWYRKGVSDILGIYNGKFLAIEVKSDTGRLSLEQQSFQRDIITCGGIAFVARSIEDVKAALMGDAK